MILALNLPLLLNGNNIGKYYFNPDFLIENPPEGQTIENKYDMCLLSIIFSYIFNVWVNPDNLLINNKFVRLHNINIRFNDNFGFNSNE